MYPAVKLKMLRNYVNLKISNMRRKIYRSLKAPYLYL